MKIIVRDEAAGDLDEIQDWIETDSPAAAVGMVRRIRAKIELLLTSGMADMGRPGRDDGTRELIEGRTSSSMKSALPAKRSLSSRSFTARRTDSRITPVQI